MYIIVGIIFAIFVFFIVKSGGMEYMHKNIKEYGYRNKDIKDAEQKR